MKYKLEVRRLDPAAKLPTLAHHGEDLGYDLYALEDTALTAGVVNRVRTGIAATAYEVSARDQPWAGEVIGSIQPTPALTKLGMIVKDRSSMAAKGIFTHAGVLDAGYIGEIQVLMTSHSKKWKHVIQAGDKIAQMVPHRVMTGEVIEVPCLAVSSRGEGAFGSSGSR